jgi:hypothetical protein
MPTDEGYRVYANAKAKQQIRDIFIELQAAGVASSFADAWIRIAAHLQADPESFGEPRFRTKLPGGMVYHRMAEQLSVHYAVFPDQKIVYVLDVSYLSQS